jgi:DNA-binding LacI/PurR family transcriptional regulator
VPNRYLVPETINVIVNIGRINGWIGVLLMATSKDVARLAGVSHTTVSRAFKPNSSIKSETYERIMRAAKQLHYTPNIIASSLRSQKTQTIGLVIAHPHVKLFMDLSQELDRELKKHNYRMLISFSEDDPALQHSALKTMVDARVDSIVYMPAVEEKANGHVAWMLQSKIQFLQIVCCVHSEFSSFTFADVPGTLVGMRHLMDHGHQKILMLGGINRVEGYYAAYRERGMEPPIPYESLEDLSIEDCREKIRHLLFAHQPTAVFSISDQISIITYGILNEMRLRIPEDISLLMFDDTLWGASLKISAIGHPVQGMAKAIVRQILDYADSDSKDQLPSSTTFMPFLIQRSSVSGPSKEGFMGIETTK